MKYLIFLLAVMFYTSAHSQQIGSKVSFAAADGKTYTGVVQEIQGEKYKIKYDGFDFDAWLAANQFTVTDANNQTGGNQPALPQVTQENNPQTIPQTTPETIPQNTGADNSGPKMMTRSDSLKMTLNSIKNAFGSVSKFFIPKRDTVTIMVSDIDYDNINLSALREGLKKVKGVRSVTMHYKSSTAIMEIWGKGKATDLWDNLPLQIKSAFKLMEAGDNNLIVKQKNTH